MRGLRILVCAMGAASIASVVGGLAACITGTVLGGVFGVWTTRGLPWFE